MDTQIRLHPHTYIHTYMHAHTIMHKIMLIALYMDIHICTHIHIYMYMYICKYIPLCSCICHPPSCFHYQGKRHGPKFAIGSKINHQPSTINHHLFAFKQIYKGIM